MIGAVSGPGVPAQPTEKERKLREVAGQLEGMFVQQLFKAMRETVPQGEGIVSGGAGEDIFTGLLDQHLAAETPKQWESGVTAALYRQLQGIASSHSSSSTTP
ncbi:MAG: rod-binding protein [Gemmatimonadota bacterium]